MHKSPAIIGFRDSQMYMVLAPYPVRLFSMKWSLARLTLILPFRPQEKLLYVRRKSTRFRVVGKRFKVEYKDQIHVEDKWAVL